jgi:hypothetical protein
VGCGGVSGIAGGTFPLDCFGLGFETGLWIEMVMTLCLSVADEKVHVIQKRRILCRYFPQILLIQL